jgi:hypothetical protein
MSHKRTTDPDNPEWTESDFARALYGTDIPTAVRSAFGKPPAKASLATIVAAQGAGFSRAALAA